jgi:heat shock protein HslJ
MRNFTLGFAALLTFSCSESTTGPDDLGLEGAWELQSLQIASGPAQSVEPGSYTAEFTADGGVTARADCNRCSGSYSSAGTGLEIGALACTRAYCGDLSLSDEYVGGLDGAASFERSGTGLWIRYPGGSLRFLARP